MTLQFTQAVVAATAPVQIDQPKNIYDHVSGQIEAQGFDPSCIVGFKVLGTNRFGTDHKGFRYGASSNSLQNFGYAAPGEPLDEPVSNPHYFYVQEVAGITEVTVVVYIAASGIVANRI